MGNSVTTGALASRGRFIFAATRAFRARGRCVSGGYRRVMPVAAFLIKAGFVKGTAGDCPAGLEARICCDILKGLNIGFK